MLVLLLLVVESFCMGQLQLVSDNQKMSPWLPDVQPEIFLKIEHCFEYFYTTTLKLVLYAHNYLSELLLLIDET